MSQNKHLLRITKLIKLYHLSFFNHDGETFHPKIPDSVMLDEDDKLNRVCFSSSMSGCYRALFSNDVVELFVHVPTNIKSKNLYKPSSYLVPDVEYTDEYWYRKPVKMKCIGKAKFSRPYLRWSSRIKPHVKIKWIEKYE